MSGEVLFLAPLRIEALATRLGAEGAPVERIGMGPARATAARVRITTGQRVSTAVALLGFGGALSDTTAPGDLVVATQILSSDGEVVADLENAAELHAALLSDGLSSHLGTIICSPRIVWRESDRSPLSNFGALVVDMESQWCAPLVARQPFAVVRAVSDVPGQRLVSFDTARYAIRALSSLRRAARVIARQCPFAVADGTVMEVRDR